MRVLLDECIPQSLRRLIYSADGIQIETAHYAGLAGMKNGQLLEALDENFDVFVTMDKNIQYQQNLSGRKFATIILDTASNDIDDILPLTDSISEILRDVKPGGVYVISAPKVA